MQFLLYFFLVSFLMVIAAVTIALIIVKPPRPPQLHSKRLLASPSPQPSPRPTLRSKIEIDPLQDRSDSRNCTEYACRRLRRTCRRQDFGYDSHQDCRFFLFVFFFKLMRNSNPAKGATTKIAAKSQLHGPWCFFHSFRPHDRYSDYAELCVFSLE